MNKKLQMPGTVIRVMMSVALLKSEADYYYARASRHDETRKTLLFGVNFFAVLAVTGLFISSPMLTLATITGSLLTFVAHFSLTAYSMRNLKKANSILDKIQAMIEELDQ